MASNATNNTNTTNTNPNTSNTATDFKTHTNTIVVKDLPYKVFTAGDKDLTIIGIEEMRGTGNKNNNNYNNIYTHFKTKNGSRE